MHAIIVLGGERITSLCAPLPEKALVIAADRGWDNALVDDINRIRLLSNEAFALRRAGFKYFGLLSLGRSTVSAFSCKYPLERSELVRDNPYATSNEITGDVAYIEVSGDGVLLIESDRLA